MKIDASGLKIAFGQGMAVLVTLTMAISAGL